jgi:hypothetical protein
MNGQVIKLLAARLAGGAAAAAAYLPVAANLSAFLFARCDQSKKN